MSKPRRPTRPARSRSADGDRAPGRGGRAGDAVGPVAGGLRERARRLARRPPAPAREWAALAVGVAALAALGLVLAGPTFAVGLLAGALVVAAVIASGVVSRAIGGARQRAAGRGDVQLGALSDGFGAATFRGRVGRAMSGQRLALQNGEAASLVVFASVAIAVLGGTVIALYLGS